jgi:type IV secretion system protein VirD4
VGKGTLTLWRISLAARVLTHWIIEAMNRDTRLHTAHFAKTPDLPPLLSPFLPQSSLLLGMRNRDIVSVSSTKKRTELGNLLAVAPTRGGKGILAVSQLLTWRHSVIVNDIKGDLFTQTAGYRSTLGPVFVIDPKGIGHTFDPLTGAATEDELYALATHLLYQADEGDGAIFTQRAITMLTQMLLASRQEKAHPFPYIRALIRSGFVTTAETLERLNPELAAQFLDDKFEKANLTDRFLLSAWGTLTARLRPLLTETAIRSLTGSSFTPEQIIRSSAPVTVYLRWREKDLLALTPLIRLLWGSLIDGMLTDYDRTQGEGCHPVLLLVDEAGRTPVPMLADHAATVVGRRLYLWVSVQDLSQLESKYGRARAKTLKNNMEHQIYYRPNDEDTAVQLEKRLGRVSEYARSHTEREQGKTTEGLSEQGVPLLTAQKIMELPDEDVLAFHRNLPPMRLKRMDWRSSKTLSLRHNMRPPALPALPPATDLRVPNTDPAARDSIIDPDEIKSDWPFPSREGQGRRLHVRQVDRS